jgi:uncharacterized membrane protein
MYSQLIHKIVISLGLFFAALTLVWNLLADRGLFHAAFMALCVLFAASTILLLAFQGVAKVLLTYLSQKREEQRREIERQKQLEAEREQGNPSKKQLTGI